MGVWGSGLYSGDFAKDIRACVSAVIRLPYDGQRLTEILSNVEPTAANNADNEDHTTFWLIIADQFEKRGVLCESVRSKALQIIDQGTDLAMLKSLGMDQPGLRRRDKVLSELRARLSAQSPTSTRRPVLKKPQPYLMEVGDLFIYPTYGGKCINPYARSKEHIPGGWAQDSWAAALIVDRGRAFDFLAWYRPLTLSGPVPHRPQFDSLRSTGPWVLRQPGTCSAVHFKRMELEKIGSASIDYERVNRLFVSMPSGTYQAINDISIANHLSISPAIDFERSFVPYQTISELKKVLGKIKGG